MDKARWSIIVHGGAQAVKKADEKQAREEIAKALQAGAQILENSGSALDAVEASVRSMEDGGLFNAGKGSEKNSSEKVQMDASIMDGRTLGVGAVAAIEDVKNPISAARVVLGEKPILLVGEDAKEFAKKADLPVKKFKSEEQDQQKDTVGCVALDQQGNIACGLSTGGLMDSMPGRVGDSVMPGCGFYADNEIAGLCLSGDGEAIARLMLAARIFHKLRDKDPKTAIEESFSYFEKVNGEAGCILITSDAQIYWHHNSKDFPVGYQSEGEKPVISLQNDSTNYPV